MIKVNEIFDSFQGEGAQQGTLCTFVRLQGCTVGCDFCDTKHTWTNNPKWQDSRRAILLKNETPSTFYALMSPVEILNACSSDLVVITGGEPFEQDLYPLLLELVGAGKQVSIETSGNSVIPENLPQAWITVSPKLTVKTDLTTLLDCVRKADEVKVVPVEDLLPTLPEIIAALSPKAILSFQPESCRTESQVLCLDLAKKYKARLSFQVHKYVKER